jgi:hypothetical protein
MFPHSRPSGLSVLATASAVVSVPALWGRLVSSFAREIDSPLRQYSRKVRAALEISSVGE